MQNLRKGFFFFLTKERSSWRQGKEQAGLTLFALSCVQKANPRWTDSLSPLVRRPHPYGTASAEATPSCCFQSCLEFNGVLLEEPRGGHLAGEPGQTSTQRPLVENI